MLSFISRLSKGLALSAPCITPWRCTATGDVVSAQQQPLGSKLLIDKFPNFAQEYRNAGKSNSVPVTAIDAESGKVAFWKCDVCSHVFKAAIISRTLLKMGCPKCKLMDHPPIGVLRPDLVKEWDEAMNDVFTDPAEVPATSTKIAHWVCPKCRHRHKARVCDKVRNSVSAKCPQCAQRSTIAFQSASVAAEWHPTRNGDLLFEDAIRMGMKAWWMCSECGEEWEANVNSRGQSQGDCPSCRSRGQEEARRAKKEMRNKRKGSKKESGE